MLQYLTPLVYTTYPFSLCDHAGVETNATSATATSATGAQPGNATGETVIVSVADAAAILGISPQAVRKQIAAGKLQAHKQRGSWRITLERATAETGATATGETEPQPRRATTQPAPQPDAQAAQMAAFADAITAPLRSRIEELNRELGHVEERLAAVTRERDELKAAQDRQEGPQMAPGEAEPAQRPTDPFDVEAAPPSWLVTLWRRWRGR